MERLTNLTAGVVLGIFIIIVMAILSRLLGFYWLDVVGLQLVVIILGTVSGAIRWACLKSPDSNWYKLGSVAPWLSVGLIASTIVNYFPLVSGELMVKGIFLLVTGLVGMGTYLLTLKSL